MVVWSPGYLAKQAPPFSDGALNISRSQQFVNQFMPWRPVFDNFPNNLGCAGTVCWWETHFQITRKIGSIVRQLTDQTQSTTKRGLIESKAMAGSQIS
jgi:hypothetical protein